MSATRSVGVEIPLSPRMLLWDPASLVTVGTGGSPWTLHGRRTELVRSRSGS